LSVHPSPLESWHQHLDKDKLLGDSHKIFIQIYPKTIVNNNIVIIRFGDQNLDFEFGSDK
jgi:hypothetical protein